MWHIDLTHSYHQASRYFSKQLGVQSGWSQSSHGSGPQIFQSLFHLQVRSKGLANANEILVASHRYLLLCQRWIKHAQVIFHIFHWDQQINFGLWYSSHPKFGWITAMGSRLCQVQAACASQLLLSSFWHGTCQMENRSTIGPWESCGIITLCGIMFQYVSIANAVMLGILHAS